MYCSESDGDLDVRRVKIACGIWLTVKVILKIKLGSWVNWGILVDFGDEYNW